MTGIKNINGKITGSELLQLLSGVVSLYSHSELAVKYRAHELDTGVPYLLAFIEEIEGLRYSII